MNITIALQNNSGLSYFQKIFHVKTVYVSGVRYWETLHLCTNSCILAHCILNKKIFVRDIVLIFFLSLSYCPYDNIKKIGTHTMHKFAQNSQKTLNDPQIVYSPIYIYCLISAEHSISSYMLGLVITISRSKGVVGNFCELFKVISEKTTKFSVGKSVIYPCLYYQWA